MVYAASAITFAIGAINAAYTLALPSHETADLTERDFDDLESREFLDDFEARDLLFNLDARDFDGMDSREIDEVLEYLRDVTSSSGAVTTSFVLKTVSVTSTYVPKPTSCTKKELRTRRAKQRAARKAARKSARKARKAAMKAKKLLAKKQAAAAAAAARTTTTGTVTRTTSATTSTSTSSSTPTATPTPTPASHNRHVHHHQHPFQRLYRQCLHHHAHGAQITAAPQTRVVMASTSTTTGKDNVVTVHLTNTVARPECTRAGHFRKLHKHQSHRSVDDETDGVFAREYNFDELD